MTVIAVTTTGVYCRPGCPARRPRRDHVIEFERADDAEREGFRACRRCRTSAGLLRACEFIARHLEGASLNRVALESGWSPFHLHREFKRRLGVTPAQYARRLRFERFAAAGGRVTAAQHAAGFGSSRGLYEKAASQLGMTPATAGRKGEGMEIAYDVVDCPLGRALVAATPLGICSVKFGASDRALGADLRRQFPQARIERDARLLRFARERLAAVFDGVDAGLPLDVRATAFQARVWGALRTIPRGETRSYAAVAREIGRPRAVRAVARAIATNPVALLIPCHRVVGSAGALTGYRWGVARKRSLLEREGAIKNI